MSEMRTVEKARVEAAKLSREQLLNVVDGWATAQHVERFFKDLEARSGTLDEQSQELLRERLATARSLFGGLSAYDHFARWGTPEDLFEEPYYWA